MQHDPAANSITETTRRGVFDELRAGDVSWFGRLNDVDFLSRVFDLTRMRSFDRRCADAADDIWQHRIRNPMDWEEDWIYSDGRFDLLHCPDETFLQFLCEMVHPVVRATRDEAERLVALFNTHLVHDGWRIVEQGQISGKPVYAASQLVDGASVAIGQAEEVAEALDSESVKKQIARMESAISHDPELAIGTAKEFLETICRTILDKCGVEHDNRDLPWLVKNSLDQIEITPGGAKPAEAKRAIRRLLGNLSGVGQSVAEVRNQLGTGHGKPAAAAELDPIYACLVVGTATALGLFIIQAFNRQEQ